MLNNSKLGQHNNDTRETDTVLSRQMSKFSATQFSLTKMKEDFVKILEKNIISEVKLKLPELKPLKEKSKISLPKLKKMEA